MRKIIFLVFFLSFVSLINASFLIDVYHKDYGYIVRTQRCYYPEYSNSQQQCFKSVRFSG
jgi:hypothetical protein